MRPNSLPPDASKMRFLATIETDSVLWVRISKMTAITDTCETHMELWSTMIKHLPAKQLRKTPVTNSDCQSAQ